MSNCSPALLSAGTMAEINITPFADVLLVLLIIFMLLTALSAPPGFQKRFACHCGHSTRPAEQLRPIEINIARNGSISIDGTRVSRAQLYAAVDAAVRVHAQRRGFSTHISLLADKDAAYDAVIKVLDAARLAGDNDVGFVTY